MRTTGPTALALQDEVARLQLPLRRLPALPVAGQGGGHLVALGDPPRVVILQAARDEMAELLHRGRDVALDVAAMARAAGVSRQTAHKALRGPVNS